MYYELYILACIIEKPRYGYEIKKIMEENFKLCTTINNNTIYPLLKKYERLGYTTRSLQINQGNPNRYIYTITQAGKQAFLTLLSDFEDELLSNRDQFFMRLMYFHFLTPAKRKRVLNYRKQFLQDGLMQSFSKHKDTSSLYQPKDEAMFDFHQNLLQSELDLIEKFEHRIHEPILTLE